MPISKEMAKNLWHIHSVEIYAAIEQSNISIPTDRGWKVIIFHNI